MDGTYDNPNSKARYFCGRFHAGPLLPRYSRENGEPWKPRQWHPGRILGRIRGIREVWTCRKPKEHWKLTIIPPYQKWKMVNSISHVTPDPRGKRQIRLAQLGKWYKPIKTTQEWRRLSFPGIEAGHHYSFNRREP